MAYNMAGRTNGCVVVESPKGSNFSSFRIQETMSRGFGETPKSLTCRIASSQDNVIWGLSTLSLHGQAQTDTDFSIEENQSVSLGAFCCASTETHRCACIASTADSSLPAYVQPSGCWRPLNLDIPSRCESLVSSSETGNQASAWRTHESATDNSPCVDVEPSPPLTAATLNHVNTLSGFCRGNEASEHGCVSSFYETLRSSRSSSCSTRNGIFEDDEIEPDTMSDLSSSSENGMLLVSSSSSRETSHDETEIESARKEPACIPFSMEASSPPRKGLSKFYAGKARSFSCMMDVGSVKDLAKPEVAHGKKRRATSSISGLPPLQKGVSTIAKKSLHSGKSTLALAVAMNRQEEYEAKASVEEGQRQQKSLETSRSHSLSDLQVGKQSIFFIN